MKNKENNILKKHKQISRNNKYQNNTQNLSDLKSNYKHEYGNYKEISNQIIDNENKIEKCQKNLNKIQSLKFKQFQEINNSFIIYLNENEDNIPLENKILLLFCFGFEFPEDEIFYFNDINELIEYFDIAKTHLKKIKKNNNEDFENLKIKISNLSESNEVNLYLQKIFYIIKIIFDEIEKEIEIKELLKEHNNLMENKNKSFISIKNIEKEIKQNGNQTISSKKSNSDFNNNEISLNKEVLQNLIVNLNSINNKENDLNLSIKSDLNNLTISSISNHSKNLTKTELTKSSKKKKNSEMSEFLTSINGTNNNKNSYDLKTVLSSNNDIETFPAYKENPDTNKIRKKKKEINFTTNENNNNICDKCIII